MIPKITNTSQVIGRFPSRIGLRHSLSVDDGSDPLTTAAASSTTVPVEERGFVDVQSCTGFLNTKSRRSSASMQPVLQRLVDLFEHLVP